MAVQARAFWVREPGVGEIRPAPVPEPGPGRGAGAHPAHRHQPRHRDARVPRRRAGRPARGDAGAVPGGRLARAGEVRLPQRRGRRGRARRTCSGRTVFCLYPHQTRLRRAGRRRGRRAATTCRRPRAVLAGTVETAVNALWDAAPLVGDRVAVVGAGMVGLLRRPAAGRHPRGGGDARGRRRRPRADVAEALGAAFALPDDAPRRPRPGRARERDLGRAAAGARRCSAPEGTVIDLSWYGDTEVTLRLGRGVPLEPARGAGQPGRHGVAGPARRGAAPPTGWRWRCELLRDPAFDALLTGSSPFEELPDVMARLADGTLPALCHTHHLPARSRRVQRDRPRPHDDRPQPARRGVRAGPAAARRDLRRRRHVPRRRRSTPTASSSTSAGRPTELAAWSAS